MKGRQAVGTQLVVFSRARRLCGESQRKAPAPRPGQVRSGRQDGENSGPHYGANTGERLCNHSCTNIKTRYTAFPRQASFYWISTLYPPPCCGDRRADSAMPNRTRHYSSLRVDKTTKRGTFRGITRSKIAQRIEVYSAAYKLAREQIPPSQMRERPDVSLRLHAFITRQLKAGATDPRCIAIAAVKDVLPETR